MANYQIQPGNTLGGIAQSNNTTIPNLMSANPNIKDPNKINAGSTLNIPGNASATNPSLTSDAAKTFVNNQVNGNNPTTPTTPTVPSTPPVPTATDNFKAAYDKYINDQGDNTSVSTAKTAYNDYVANQAKGGIALEGRGLGVPLQLVRGEQAQLLKQSQPEATRLQNAVTIAQGDQTAKINAAKTGVDYSKALMDQETAANKLATAPFNLSTGQDRFQYNPTTKTYDKISSGEAKPVPINAGSKPTISGGLTYTPQMKTEDSQALNASKGSDGYVDPAVYKQLADAWVSHGGLMKDFLSVHPPKDYVNPANDTLPSYLRSSKPSLAKKSASSVQAP